MSSPSALPVLPSTLPVLHASLVERLQAMRGQRELSPALLDLVLGRTELPGQPDAELVRPRDWGALREAEKAAGRPTPYWAVSWASGRALARVAAGAGLSGQRALELGCGLGLVSVAAARAGAKVTALDASGDAVVFAAHNLALNDQAGDVTRSHFREAATLLGDEPADLVLAADVLYIRQNVELLIELLPRLLTEQGEIWITDPGRTGWDEFRGLAKGRWRIASSHQREHPRVWLHRLTRRRPGRGR